MSAKNYHDIFLKLLKHVNLIDALTKKNKKQFYLSGSRVLLNFWIMSKHSSLDILWIVLSAVIVLFLKGTMLLVKKYIKQ